MMDAMRFVYVLKNAQNPPRCYVGITTDVAARLQTSSSRKLENGARKLYANPALA